MQLDEVIAVVSRIEQQKNRRLKALLTALELKHGKLSPETRKLILDAFNDYTRTVFQMIGYNVEQ